LTLFVTSGDAPPASGRLCVPPRRRMGQDRIIPVCERILDGNEK
jgi:hypothetical protein